MGSFGIARRLVGMAVTIGMLVGCGTAARLATADSGDLKGLAQARKTMSLLEVRGGWARLGCVNGG